MCRFEVFSNGEPHSRFTGHNGISQTFHGRLSLTLTLTLTLTLSLSLTLALTLTLAVNSGAGELTDKCRGMVSTVCKFCALKHTNTNNNKENHMCPAASL